MEVLGWWSQDLDEAPEWLPIAGPLHEDSEFFKLHQYHYHVDARFLTESEEKVAADKNRRQKASLSRLWHRTALAVMTCFPVPHDPDWHLEITRGVTRLSPNFDLACRRTRSGYAWREPRRRKRLTRTEDWGLARIRTRQVLRACLRNLPEIAIEEPAVTGTTIRSGTTGTSSQKPSTGQENDVSSFVNLRRRFPNAIGDTCPHRGHDLRSVPIEADGCRQCPLHQLRVRAPGNKNG